MDTGLHFWKEEDHEAVKHGLEFIWYSRVVKAKSISILNHDSGIKQSQYDYNAE